MMDGSFETPAKVSMPAPREFDALGFLENVFNRDLYAASDTESLAVGLFDQLARPWPLRALRSADTHFSCALFENTGPVFRRDKEHWTGAIGVVLDDIGETKNGVLMKAPPVEPTAIIETKPGSRQWIYLFNGIERDREVVDTIQRSAIAGEMCDPNAGTITRITRLPGSLPEGKEHKARIVWADWTRRFDPRSIIEDVFQVPRVEAPAQRPARPANVPPAPPSPAYGEKALQGQIATLLAAPPGTRNAALNIAALKLGQLVPDGHLSESLIIERLTEAAADIGQSASEAAATIKSGMTKGMTEPRGPGGDALARLGAGPRNTFRHNSLSLIRDDKDRPIWNAHNAIALLLQHDDWQGVLAFNEFTVRRVLLRAVPGQGGGVYPRPLEDDDYTAAQAWFNNNGFPKASMEIVRAAVRKVCRHQAFDPLRDYLDGLQWDGAPRLSSWLTTYCGAEPSAYVSEVGRRWCISAVARGFKPGVKADCMIVLEGAQGRRKSSALAALAGEDWFSDALPQMGTKDASSYLRGKWIIEVAELEAMRKEMDAIKAFISRQVESYRPAYGREDVYEPRRCIFAGSTNKDDWQRDETGGRRFWPVRVGSIDVDAIARDRGQLWAEAVHLYRAGERWWLEGEEADQAQAEVAERRPDDPWRADIARVVEGRAEVTTKEVLHELHVLPVDMTPQLSKRVAQELVALGWVRDGRVTTGQMKGAARYVPGEAQ
ncbi:virulence-associated E family protein [Roseinatronobacter ekhonensis]|nr:virulence-associated E family protein [Roseibaca ekhonensis]